MSSSRTVGRAGLVGAATLGSRVLGLLREHVFAKIFGAELYADAFMIAFRIPNLLRDLFAEGVLSSALVPTLVDQKARGGSEEAFRVGQAVLSAILVIVGGLTVLGVLFAPFLVDVISQYEGEKRELTIVLTRWLMPFLLIVASAAVCRGVLNSHERFTAPALAPVLFNVVAVAVGYALWFLGHSAQTAIFGWSMGIVGGAVMTVLVQLPSLRRIGFRFRPSFDWRHPGFRRVVRQMAPAILGLAAGQLNIIINSSLASSVEGNVSYLTYSFRLLYLPVGVIGVAVATVATVNLAAAVAGENRGMNLREQLAEALRWVFFFGLPATAGLIVLAEPIVRLIFEYGKFDSADTVSTARALRWYAVGLLFLCGVKVVAPAFYALDRMRVAVVASVSSVVVNITWALSTYGHWGYPTLAAGMSIAGIVNFSILALMIAHELDHVPWGAIVRSLVRSVLVTAAIGAGAWWLHAQLADALGTAGMLARSVAVLVPVGLSVLFLIFGGRLIGLRESREITGLLRRRSAV